MSKLYKKLIKHKFSAYKQGAYSRNISFDLTFRDFQGFWGADCYYCGNAIPTIGLDRIDNLKGYEKDNVVPCCTMCNRMKLTLPENIFIEHCKKITWNRYSDKPDKTYKNFYELYQFTGGSIVKASFPSDPLSDIP